MWSPTAWYHESSSAVVNPTPTPTPTPPGPAACPEICECGTFTVVVSGLTGTCMVEDDCPNYNLTYSPMMEVVECGYYNYMGPSCFLDCVAGYWKFTLGSCGNWKAANVDGCPPETGWVWDVVVGGNCEHASATVTVAYS